MALSLTGIDLRRFSRFKANFPAIASVVGDCEIISLRVGCESICEGGVSISGVAGFDVGDLVSLEMHVPVAKDALWVDTVVRHSSEARCGLEFRPLGPDQRDRIKHYCSLQPLEKRRRWSAPIPRKGRTWLPW